MDNASLAAQAVATSPSAIAPAAFNGHEWLIVLNLWSQTVGFLVAAIVVATLIGDGIRHRHRDVPGWSPARLWRLVGLLFSTGIMLRCGGGALVMWGWNIDEPGKTAGFLFIQRVVDPVAISFGVGGLVMFVLSLPGVLHQLRREPLPIDIWQAWPIVRRMMAVAALVFVAAVGVTVTR